MLNCSNETDYNNFVEKLKEVLHKRGYPAAITTTPSEYDAKRRLQLLKDLYNRAKAKSDFVDENVKSKDKNGKELLVLKCDYSPHFAKLQLHRGFRKLLRQLRAHLGEGFLDTGRLVIAHPVYTNAFLDTHAYNFPYENKVKCGNRRRGEERF